MSRKTFSKGSITDEQEFRPVGPPLLCGECGAIFQELTEDDDKVLMCAWCFGGGPFEELDFHTDEKFPTVTYARLCELQTKNKLHTFLLSRKGDRHKP